MAPPTSTTIVERECKNRGREKDDSKGRGRGRGRECGRKDDIRFDDDRGERHGEKMRFAVV
ncbi:MAG: hypothetical protein ACOYMR_15405 [Ilumatobacteraceae bacterium]